MNYKEQCDIRPLRIVIAYATVASLWIISSELLMRKLIVDLALFNSISIWNGLFFVGVSSVVLFMLLKRHVKRVKPDMPLLREGEMRYSAMVENNRQAEKEMEKERDFLAAILDCIEVGVVACDQEGVITFFNRTTSKTHGINEAKLRPDELAEHLNLFGPDGKAPLKMVEMPLYSALHGVEVTNQEVAVKPEGAQPVNMLISGRQLQDCNGNKLGAVISALDMTAIKKLDEQLRQSQKFDAIGILAGGVAHDFNNILTVIMGACTLLKMKTKSDPELEPFVRQIMDYSERAAQLIQNLLVFSRKQNLRLLPADINEIVLTLNEILGQSIGEEVRLVAVPSPVPLSVSVDRGQLEQAMVYLAANAREAMPNGGELRIEASMADSSEILLDLDGSPKGLYARIDVTDTGIGMDVATMSRIFEPFYSTKEYGRRTGLGLSLAYGIVKQHKGAIEVSSEPGRGSTFSIFLPLLTAGPNEHDNG